MQTADRITHLRTGIKKIANNIVPTAFGLSDMNNEEIRETVAVFLADMNYTYPLEFKGVSYLLPARIVLLTCCNALGFGTTRHNAALPQPGDLWHSRNRRIRWKGRQPLFPLRE